MVVEALRYVKNYEIWIYVGVGILAFWYIRKFALAWDETREAAFGIERELAQSRLNHAAMVLIVLLMVVIFEFSLVSFVVPSMPEVNPIPSPTLNILATPTATLGPGEPTSVLPTAATPGAVNPAAGCVAGQVTITSPKNGDEVSGVVKLKGSANIPDFGFYKYEIARPGETAWLSINAGDKIVKDGDLGEWVTNVLPPGDYMLRLVVTDNKGSSQPPCVIQVRVVAAAEP